MAANSVYFVLTAAGLGALVMASETLFATVRLVGAAYLVYLGLKFILGTRNVPRETGGFVEPSVPGRQYFRQGLITQLANPNHVVYFTAILPQFVDPSSAIPPQFVVLGTTSVIVEFAVLLFYGRVAHLAGRQFVRLQQGVWVQRIAGTFLLGAALRLALTRRD